MAPPSLMFLLVRGYTVHCGQRQGRKCDLIPYRITNCYITEEFLYSNISNSHSTCF